METWQSTIGTTVSFWECVSWKVQIGDFSGGAAVAPKIGYKSHVEMFPAHKRPRCCPDILRCFDIVQGPVVLGIPWWQVIQHCWGAETTVAASCFVSCGRFRCWKIGIDNWKSLLYISTNLSIFLCLGFWAHTRQEAWRFFSQSDMSKGLWTHRWYRLSIPKGVGPLRMAPWFLERRFISGSSLISI